MGVCTLNKPIMYDEQLLMNEFCRTRPMSVHGQSSLSNNFYDRYLYNKIYSVYNFKLPDYWELNWFRYILFHWGSIAVINTKEYGWIPMPYGVTEINFQYQPKKIEVANSFIPTTIEGVIGENAEIVKCLDDYRGFEDIVRRYSTKLSTIDKDIDINLMNCNASMWCSVENNKQAQTVKKAYEDASMGQPLVVTGGDFEGFQPMFKNLGQTYLVDKLQIAKRTCLNEFLTEIGIRNANQQKRERLISSEIAENNDETSAIAHIVYTNIKSAFEKINAISNLGLEISLNYDYMNGGEEDEADLVGDDAI